MGQDHGNRDIILKRRAGSLMRISETHRTYDALQYPLMFPRGEDGYNLKPPKLCNGTRLVIKEMYSYVLKVQITGKFKGEDVFIPPRIPLIPTDLPFQYTGSKYQKFKNDGIEFD